MRIAKVIPLYVRKSPLSVSLVCRVDIHDPLARTCSYTRYFPPDLTYDDIEESIFNTWDVQEVHIQKAWFLPEQYVEKEPPF